MSTAKPVVVVEEKQNKAWIDGIAGGGGGVLAKSLLAPMQRVVVMRQIGDHHHMTTPQLVKEIYHRDGLKGFWRGNLTSIIIRFPYGGVQLLLYARIKFMFQRMFGIDETSTGGNVVAQKFVMKCGAGGVAASIAGAAVYPGEVIRLRLMSGNEQYKGLGILGVAKKIWAETNGPRNFYAGLNASLVQRVPDILLNFAVYETVKYEMGRYGYGDTLTTAVGGSAAALTSIAFVFPLDVAKRKIGMAGNTADGLRYRSIWHCLTHTLKTRGVANGLYAGAGVEAMRCMPQVVIMWLAIENIRKFLNANF